MRKQRRVLVAWVLCLGCSLTGCDRRARPEALRGAAATPEIAQTPLVGTPSCSGSACHSNLTHPTPSASQTSFPDWIRHDPHVSAYAVLHGKLAGAMGEKLGIDAATDVRCLACHTNPQAAVSEDWARAERVHGVGCESCHGAARNWLSAHRDPSWQRMEPAEKRKKYDEHGMTWLSSLKVRAETCVGCHIGAAADARRGLPHREVTHEFLAAGHPRLLFEFGAYHANLPKHWREKNPMPDFEARAWATGQVVSAQAALKLLEESTGADSKRAWPEFAHFDCYACHQGLGGNKVRASSAKNVAGRGSLPLLSWHLAVVPNEKMDLVAIELPHGRPWPNAAAVHEFSKSTATNLAPRAEFWANSELTRDDLESLRKALVLRAQAAPRSWDKYEQVALGLAALLDADRHLRKKANLPAALRDLRWEAAVDRLLKELAFPAGQNSPKQLRTDVLDDDAFKPLLELP